MGLDMFLYQKVECIDGFRHRSFPSAADVPAGPFSMSNVQRVSDHVVQVAYWRKANAIHGWFVEHCQGGVDECQETPVSWSSLMQLRDLCAEVIRTKNYRLLPPVPGFFFGSTEADDWYLEYLEDTVKMLSDIDPDGTYVYHSSW